MVENLEMPITDGAEDSERAASLLHRAGAGCILVLGGDGTLRAVSKGVGVDIQVHGTFTYLAPIGIFQ